MIGEVCLTLACIAQTGATVYALRTLSAVHRRSLNGILATTPQEFVMMEKHAQPTPAKATKTPAPIPFGL